MTTVYISIGNSDDKLGQREWCSFVARMDEAVAQEADHIHGRWFSLPDAPWQNACWCVEVSKGSGARLREAVASARGYYRQDSATWAETTVEFI